MTEVPSLTLEFSLVAEAEAGAFANEENLETLARSVLEAEGAAGAWEVILALVSDDELQSLHLRFMGIDEPTDIMTFPFGEGLLGGDLAISADHARRRAAEWGNSPAEEVEFLLAHGVLHLLGWQDTSPEQREAMLERQQALVTAWRAAS